jgi:hypothetical protein
MKDENQLKALMSGIRERSGSITIDCKLTSFLYTLMRDHVQPGDIEDIMLNHVPDAPVEYCNGWLAKYAQDVAIRLQVSSGLTIIESPFAGDVDAHIKYAQRAMSDSLNRGEFPYASHLLFTQPNILNDNIPEQRQLGIDAGLAWGKFASLSAVYTDYGISRGMEYGIERAKQEGRPVEFREIGKNG